MNGDRPPERDSNVHWPDRVSVTDVADMARAFPMLLDLLRRAADPLSAKILDEVARRMNRLSKEVGGFLHDVALVRPEITTDFYVVARHRKPGRRDRIYASVWTAAMDEFSSVAGTDECRSFLAICECLIREETKRREPGGIGYKKRDPLRHKKALVAEALRKGLSPVDAFQFAGVSKRHGYRIMAMPD